MAGELHASGATWSVGWTCRIGNTVHLKFKATLGYGVLVQVNEIQKKPDCEALMSQSQSPVATDQAQATQGPKQLFLASTFAKVIRPGARILFYRLLSFPLRTALGNASL